MNKTLDRALVWLRRDLRTDDSAALYHALRAARHVWCGFIHDRTILDPLPRADRRVEFIHDTLACVDADLRALQPGAGLVVRHGAARDALPRLAVALGVQAVYASHDDDPYALERDAAVRGSLAAAGIALHTVKDHVVFERSELLTHTGNPFSVYTPYRDAWLKRLEPFDLKAYAIAPHAAALAPLPDGQTETLPTLADIGFERTNLHELQLPAGPAGGAAMLSDFIDRIDRYADGRDSPAVKAPSYLGPHLRFGLLSVRRLAREARERSAAGSRGAEVWLSELIWRDFYNQLLHHQPHVATGPCKRGFDRIKWDHGKAADALFDAWCEGRTGYPIVDAAMAQINQTGYMHNRLRLISASFLCKDLGLDYRRGEAYFALHLNCYDLASNNGNWQWVAATGCDAQPYYRIFNPVLQSRKFDPEGRFIRRYLPQLARLPDALIHAPWQARPVELAAAGIELGRDYPAPVVDHETARERTLARYVAAGA